MQISEPISVTTAVPSTTTETMMTISAFGIVGLFLMVSVVFAVIILVLILRSRPRGIQSKSVTFNSTPNAGYKEQVSYCSQCGAQTVSGSNFCVSCGEAII